MKVRNLIKDLQTLDGDAEVYLQSDAEGNGYSLLSGVGIDEGVYTADTDSGIDFLSRYNSVADMEDSYGSGLDFISIAILYP